MPEERSAEVVGGVRLHVAGPVATVTLDRPPRNAQVPSTWAALAAIPEQLDDGVRVIVLRATGRIFSAGLDLAMLAPGGVAGEPSAAELAADPALDQRIASFQRGFTWWADHPAISIAVVQGHAVGAGFQLALAADLRVVSTAARFAMAEITLGLVPDLGGPRRLAELAGPAAALDLVATGRSVPALEAARLRLADRVAEPDQLEAEVDQLVGSLLAVPAPALRAAKGIMSGVLDRPRDQQLACERAAQAPLLAALVARSPSA